MNMKEIEGYSSLEAKAEAKRMELAKSLFSQQNHAFPLRNAKQVLRQAGELMQICALIQDRHTSEWGDK